jgi:hypothetical protein
MSIGEWQDVQLSSVRAGQSFANLRQGACLDRQFIKTQEAGELVDVTALDQRKPTELWILNHGIRHGYLSRNFQSFKGNIPWYQSQGGDQAENPPVDMGRDEESTEAGDDVKGFLQG